MSKRNVIEDKSNDRKYFALVPNIVDDLGLSVYAYRLYGHLKRLAGESGVIDDPAKTATSALAADCKMSAGKVTHAKRELEAHGLISLTTGQAARKNIRPPHIIRVLDIWQRNMEHFQSLNEQKRERLQVQASPSIHVVNRTYSAGEQKQTGFYSPHEILEEPKEQKNIGAVAQHATLTPVSATAVPSFGVTMTIQTPTPKVDPLTDIFERSMRAKQKPNDATIRAWNLQPHLETLCLWFAEDTGVMVTKADCGKWSKGASRNYELHPTRLQHQQAVKRFKAQKGKDGTPLTLTHPLALYETLKEVMSEQATKQPAANVELVETTDALGNTVYKQVSI